MHAWRVHEYGNYRELLTWEECDEPSPPEAGVVVEVEAAGLNFPDLLFIAGKYQVKAPLPFVPGMEASGRVIAAGKKSRFGAGDRVIATNLWGAFGERMALPDQTCFRMPDQMTGVHAAALTIVYQTGYFALDYRARLQKGEVLLVHGGSGGVGTAAIQIGKALGATVIATAGNDEKLDICRRCGADHLINYRDDDFVREVKKLTSGRGADVIFDPIGGDVFDSSLKCIAFGGRVLVIGFASGRIPEVRTNRILLKNISVIGLNWGNHQFHEPARIHATHDRLCEMYCNGEIEPIIYREYQRNQLPEALAAIEKRASYGKVILRMRSE
ncbi:MAG: NADPH:quinone oxidoreductase family protein [Proteobacteria bacterium]|nr:NADPH:quinone oxidoreductase family protein [Pseudomonadota bacterium]